MITKSIKSKGKRKAAHGSPLPSRGVTPRSQDRWAQVEMSNSPRYACGCGLRLDDYWAWVDHTNVCRKVGGV